MPFARSIQFHMVYWTSTLLSTPVSKNPRFRCISFVCRARYIHRAACIGIGVAMSGLDLSILGEISLLLTLIPSRDRAVGAVQNGRYGNRCQDSALTLPSILLLLKPEVG